MQFLGKVKSGIAQPALLEDVSQIQASFQMIRVFVEDESQEVFRCIQLSAGKPIARQFQQSVAGGEALMVGRLDGRGPGDGNDEWRRQQQGHTGRQAPVAVFCPRRLR